MTKQAIAKVKVKKGIAGLGLFALENIPKDTLIVEYTGEVISNDEADRRGGKYLFEINSKWTIDGKSRTNTARYVNHSCRPNAESDTIGKKVKYFAKRTIKAGEEITVDYGKEYFNDFIKPYGCRCEKCKATV